MPNALLDWALTQGPSGDPFEAAASRVKGSVRNRKEGPANRLLEALGQAIANAVYETATLPKRYIDSAADYVPGQSVLDRQQSTQLAPEIALNMVGTPGGAGGLGSGIRAYHGSPHDFDKFSLSKIGTGEGAQAYGHGLYFADSEGVARFYRDQLSKPLREIKQIADPYRGLPDAEAVKKIETAVQQFEARGDKSTARDYRDAADWIKSGRSEDFRPGRMYEVNINAHPDQFLDWDKPIRDQPVAGAVRDLVSPDLRKTYDYNAERGITGANAYYNFYPGGKGGLEIASRRLNDAGIPGIKYLDQGSRSAGNGSRNYVVFNDSLIDILRKYGIGAGAALPAANMLYQAGQPQQQ